MPFRHVAMYRWAAHVGSEHVDRVRTALDELASLVPGVQHHGSDVGVSEGTFDYLVVADFETVADWRAYRDHPAHVVLVAELIDGHVVERVSGQYQVPDLRDAHDVSASRMEALLDAPDEHIATGPADESDDELLARARRTAMAQMQALLAAPDEHLDTGPAAESDEELLARARRTAMAEMQALLAETDETDEIDETADPI